MADKQPQEPMLAVNQIQGNVIPGFNKDFQAFLFLKIVEVSRFRRWLGTLSFTTMEQVLAFVRLRKEEERLGKPLTEATWVNIAFSHDALVKLGMITEKVKFTDQAYRLGLRARSNSSLGDQID